MQLSTWQIVSKSAQLTYPARFDILLYDPSLLTVTHYSLVYINFTLQYQHTIVNLDLYVNFSIKSLHWGDQLQLETKMYGGFSILFELLSTVIIAIIINSYVNNSIISSKTRKIIM